MSLLEGWKAIALHDKMPSIKTKPHLHYCASLFFSTTIDWSFPPFFFFSFNQYLENV